MAFPTFGGGDPYLPAPLRVTHHDGTLTTRLVLVEVRRETVPDGEHVVVVLGDELVDLTVELHLRTHPASGVLEQWVEISTTRTDRSVWVTTTRSRRSC